MTLLFGVQAEDPATSAVIIEGRGLSDRMMEQFRSPDGLLHPILEAVLGEPERRLAFAIRDHYVDIYYLGTNLMEIRQVGPKAQGLEAWWDPRYLPSCADRPWSAEASAEELATEAWLKGHGVLGRCILRDKADVARHVESIPYRMRAMDACKRRHPKLELRAQQEIVRLSTDSADGDYLACDTEYTFKHDRHALGRKYRSARKVSRIDVVMARRTGKSWSDGPARLVLVELKCGSAAIDGPAGLRSHVRDVGRYLVEAGELRRIADDMVRITRQKRELGVAPVAIEEFDLVPPVDYVVAVARHDPRSQILRDALLGRHGLDEDPLEVPDGLRVSVILLDESRPVLRRDELIPLDDVLAGPIPPAIFEGNLRPRRLRADERR